MIKAVQFLAVLVAASHAYFDNGATILYPIPVSYQCGYSLRDNNLMSAIDVNADIVFLSLGANFTQRAASKLFIGAGFGGFVQAQYGYNVTKSTNIFRVRTDIPFSVFTENSVFRWISAGAFYEYDFGRNSGAIVGVNLGINTSLYLF